MQYLQLYGLSGVANVMPLPIQSPSAPSVTYGDAVIGQVLSVKSTGDLYMYGGYVNGNHIWKSVSANAAGNFTSITVTTGPNVINGALLINNNTNQAVGINTGTSTGSVTIKNSTGTGDVNIRTGSGAGNVHIADGTSVGTVTIGNANSTALVLAAPAVTIGAAGSPTITSGAGAPNSNQPKGSLYLRTDGTTTTSRMYVATDAVGGWTAVTTVA